MEKTEAQDCPVCYCLDTNLFAKARPRREAAAMGWGGEAGFQSRSFPNGTAAFCPCNPNISPGIHKKPTAFCVISTMVVKDDNPPPPPRDHGHLSLSLHLKIDNCLPSQSSPITGPTKARQMPVTRSFLQPSSPLYQIPCTCHTGTPHSSLLWRWGLTAAESEAAMTTSPSDAVGPFALGGGKASSTAAHG